MLEEIPDPDPIHSPPDRNKSKSRLISRIIILSIVVLIVTAAGFVGFISEYIQWPFGGDSEVTPAITTAEHLLESTQPEEEPQQEPIQSTVVDLDAVRAQMQEFLSKFQCANAIANLAPDDRLSIDGFVSTREDLDKIRDEISRLAGVKNLDEDLAVHPWPFCEMLVILQQHQSSDVLPSLQTRLELNNLDGRYQLGDYLVVNATVGNVSDGYLYVDYLDSDGTVVHMLPSPKRHKNDVIPGETVVIGAEGDDPRGYFSYKIEPPHGRGLIVAITSPTALFELPPREHVETASDYFPILRAALQGAALENTSQELMVTFQFIEILE